MKRPWQRTILSGDCGVLLEFGNSLNPETNRLVHQTVRALNNAVLDGVWGLVPAYTTLLIEFDPWVLSPSAVIAWANTVEVENSREASRVFEIPVCYGDEFGPDLESIAEQLHMSTQEFVDRHSAGTYHIYCLGFSPGFPLCGVLPADLQVPRRASPRPRVLAGSVAIAGMQTGIYPTASPGGWHLVGRTPLKLFSLHSDPPVPYRAGDQLRFRPINAKEFHALEDATLRWPLVIEGVPDAEH